MAAPGLRFRVLAGDACPVCGPSRAGGTEPPRPGRMGLAGGDGGPRTVSPAARALRLLTSHRRPGSHRVRHVHPAGRTRRSSQRIDHAVVPVCAKAACLPGSCGPSPGPVPGSGPRVRAVAMAPGGGGEPAREAAGGGELLGRGPDGLAGDGASPGRVRASRRPLRAGIPRPLLVAGRRRRAMGPRVSRLWREAVGPTASGGGRCMPVTGREAAWRVKRGWSSTSEDKLRCPFCVDLVGQVTGTASALAAALVRRVALMIHRQFHE